MKGRIMEEYGVLKVWMTYASIVRVRGETRVDYVKRVVASISVTREEAQKLVNDHAQTAGTTKGAGFDYEWVVEPVKLTPNYADARRVRVAEA
jgi:hypothetical protein